MVALLARPNVPGAARVRPFARVRRCYAAASTEPASSPGLSIGVFSSAPYVQEFMGAPMTKAFPGRVRFIEARLHAETVSLAAGFDIMCLFVNDRADAPIIAQLSQLGAQDVGWWVPFARADSTCRREAHCQCVAVSTCSDVADDSRAREAGGGARLF